MRSTEFVLFSFTSSLEAGRTAGGKEDREGQTIFTALNLFVEKFPDEEEDSDDLSAPRRVHHHSSWKHDQDAVYWMRCLVHRIKDYDFERRNLTQ